MESERDEVEQSGGAPILTRDRLRVAAVAGVALAVIALGVTTFLLERRSFDLESALVGKCADGTVDALALGNKQVDAMYNYVRPTLEGAVPPTEAGMRAMVAQAAEDAQGYLSSARESCDGIDILPFHSSLRDRHAACLRSLELEASYLGAVAQDGRTARPRGDTC